MGELDRHEDAALVHRLQQTLERNGAKVPDELRVSPKMILELDTEARRDIAFRLIKRNQSLARERHLQSARKSLTAANVLKMIPLLCRSDRFCAKEITHFVARLEPHCFPSNETSGIGSIDLNPCFAGDGLLHETLVRLKLNPALEANAMMDQLLLDIGDVPEGGAFELQNSYRKIRPEKNLIPLFTLLAIVGTSGNSGLTGWLQGFEDRLLIDGLRDPKVDTEEIYWTFKVHQRAKIKYQVLREYAESRRIEIRISGHSWKQWNRHNLMAASLGCGMIDKTPDQAKFLLALTGIAYEGKDFASHLKGGYRLKDAVQNFLVDTKRYREAGFVGRVLCRAWSTPHN